MKKHFFYLNLFLFIEKCFYIKFIIYIAKGFQKCDIFINLRNDFFEEFLIGIFLILKLKNQFSNAKSIIPIVSFYLFVLDVLISKFLIKNLVKISKKKKKYDNFFTKNLHIIFLYSLKLINK